MKIFYCRVLKRTQFAQEIFNLGHCVPLRLW